MLLLCLSIWSFCPKNMNILTWWHWLADRPNQTVLNSSTNIIYCLYIKSRLQFFFLSSIENKKWLIWKKCTPNNIQRGAEHGTKANHYSHDLCCNTPVGTVTCLLIKQIWKQCDQILSQGNSFQKWISAIKLTMWLVIFFNDIHQKRDFFTE